MVNGQLSGPLMSSHLSDRGSSAHERKPHLPRTIQKHSPATQHPANDPDPDCESSALDVLMRLDDHARRGGG